MHRDVPRLAARTFDVLVVGGGIYGLTIAYDAAQRGLSVALIERDDFGSGASFNHLRTIHGGLRYLQTLDIGRARDSMRERRAIAAVAPHTVRPLAFMLPLYPSIGRGAAALRAGFLLDRLVAMDRNRGVPASHRLPAGRVVPRSELHQFDGLYRSGATGAALWYDYVAAEADRLTFSFALAASACGAMLVNYMEATALIAEGSRVTGVRAHDRLTGRDFELAAQVTLNATGGAADRLLGPIGARMRLPMIKAMNLVTRRQAGDTALGGRSKARRNLFLVPWRGRALFGTWESARPCGPEDASVSTDDVLGFVRELNETFPSLALSRNDVSLVHRGIVPAVERDGAFALESRELVRDHASDRASVEGLVSVIGTKYTTARKTAERVTDRLLAKLHRPPVPCRTAIVPLPGGSRTDLAQALAEARREGGAELPEGTAAHLVQAYGSRYREILALGVDRPDLKKPVSGDSPVIGAELVWAVRNEMAVTLADAVIRRTPLGALGYPGDTAVERAAAIVGPELDWPAERIAGEVAAVRAFYEIG